MSSPSLERQTSAMARLPELAEFRFQLRKFLSFSETVSEAAGVAAQQYQLMQVIEALPPGQKASITHLAERMVLRHNSTVELVDRAERAKLVRREADSTDMRRSLVELTQKGRDTLISLVELHLQELDVRGHKMIDALHGVFGSAAAAPSASTPEGRGE